MKVFLGINRVALRTYSSQVMTVIYIHMYNKTVKLHVETSFRQASQSYIAYVNPGVQFLKRIGHLAIERLFIDA